MRLDHLQRPELNKGTIDFVVSEEYWANNAPPTKITSSYVHIDPLPILTNRKPEPLHYVFAFDVSAESVETGFLKSSCDALLVVLFGETPEISASNLAPESKITILTFDQSLHFYNLSVRSHLLFADIVLREDLASPRRCPDVGGRRS